MHATFCIKGELRFGTEVWKKMFSIFLSEIPETFSNHIKKEF